MPPTIIFFALEITGQYGNVIGLAVGHTDLSYLEKLPHSDYKNLLLWTDACISQTKKRNIYGVQKFQKDLRVKQKKIEVEEVISCCKNKFWAAHHFPWSLVHDELAIIQLLIKKVLSFVFVHIFGFPDAVLDIYLFIWRFVIEDREEGNRRGLSDELEWRGKNPLRGELRGCAT